MKPFAYAAPKDLKDALALLSERWGETEILAGGTDLVTCLKQGLAAPDRLVSLKNIRALRGIRSGRDGVTLGAMTPLAEVRAHKEVRQRFPALVAAIDSIGSPQLLAAGTVGGDLCQRPRCWYYRNGHGLLARHGDTSLVRSGDNRYHAIFGTDGPALYVSPSRLGPVLVALNAELTVAGPGGKTRAMEVAQLFQTPRDESQRHTTLAANEIITEIRIPHSWPANANYEVRHRHGLDWPYVTAAVALRLQDGVAAGARVVLGHVAPVPWVAGRAAELLNGARIDETIAARCGEMAVEGAQPLSGNSYKVQMVKTAVKRAVLAAAQA